MLRETVINWNSFTTPFHITGHTQRCKMYLFLQMMFCHDDNKNTLFVTNPKEQAGARLGQAQIKIGLLGNLANFTYYIYLIELAI